MGNEAGHNVTVTKKEKDNIYWGKTASLKIKFRSDGRLEIGQKIFVNNRDVLERQLPDEIFRGYKEVKKY